MNCTKYVVNVKYKVVYQSILIGSRNVIFPDSATPSNFNLQIIYMA